MDVNCPQDSVSPRLFEAHKIAGRKGFWCIKGTIILGPARVNIDGNAASHRALRLLGEEDPKWQTVAIRARRYLNNIVEQDHRAIKQRCASMLGLKSFRTAAVIFSGIELAHRIRKRQFALRYERNGRPISLNEVWSLGLRDQTYRKPTESSLRPLTHQNSNRHSIRRRRHSRVAWSAVRYPRKLSFGQSLYLLIMPKGSRYWRYRYRFQGREKMISLGCYPDVPTASAWARHRVARQLLAQGDDPARHRMQLRQVSAESVRQPPSS